MVLLGSVCPSAVSTGSVGFLDQPCSAFVRLQKAVLLESVMEVLIPVRFLFLLLGPSTASDYQQIGRSMSTLMSDQVSSKVVFLETTSRWCQMTSFWVLPALH